GDLNGTGGALDAADRLYRAGLTDGLPVVVPTARRIEVMLAGYDPDGDARLASVEPIPPGFAVPTPWDAAACAVMAGCEPGALPLVMAALSATSDFSFNLL